MKHAKPFLILSALLLITLGVVLMMYDKAQLHLAMNAYHSPMLDLFFRHFTCVGEWVPYVIAVGLLFYKAGWAVFLLVDVLLSGLFVQIAKHIFNTDRPYLYFAQNMPDVQLPLVEGVTLSRWFSFPSGHTVTFFVLFLTLTFVLTEMTKPTYDVAVSPRNGSTIHSRLGMLIINLICFLFAVLGAYSRIYLSQHFAEDIFGGMIVGIVTTCLLYIAVPSLQKKSFWDWRVKKTGEK